MTDVVDIVVHDTRYALAQTLADTDELRFESEGVEWRQRGDYLVGASAH